MDIQERYLQDIGKCLDVYKSLYKMQNDDKISAFNYIGDFYNKAKTEQGKKQIIDNAECYRRVMCNIHLFRWLEIERNAATPNTVKSLQQNGLWSKNTRELAESALNIFKELGITPSQNGYSLSADVLKNYINMSHIETQTDNTDIADDLGDFDIDLTPGQGEAGVQFDSFDKKDIGFQSTEDDFDEFDDFDDIEELDLGEEDEEEDPGEPEDYSDIEITDDDIGDISDSQTSDAEVVKTESGSESKKENLEEERKRIAAEREAESNRVEIPIDINVNKDIELAFGDFVEMSHVSSLMKTFQELYESCFSGIQSPDGILTPNGVLNYEQLKGDSKKQWHFNHQVDKIQGKTFIYKNYMNMVLYALGVLNGATSCQTTKSDTEIVRLKKQAIESGRQYLGQAIGTEDQETGRFPNLKHLSKGNAYYPFMHEAFMTGYYGLCAGLKKEAEEKNYVRNTVKVTNYTDLSKWIKEKIKGCLLKAVEDSGLTSQSETFEVDHICKIMLNAIKNVVIIQDKQKGYITIKICQNTLKFDKQRLERLLNEYLRSSSGATSGVRAVVKTINCDVATVDIVNDEKTYSQSSMLASSVIDSIVESGQIPSWKNAIIGKGETGIVRYDFTKSDKCSVQIYGASGSGKGIMTSALLQNALIDNCNIFYFDGKPDNGAALAKIAWDRDKEAAVYNGLSGGQNTFPGKLEQFSHGLRSEDQLYCLDKYIPDFEKSPLSDKVTIAWPFSSKGQGGVEREASDLRDDDQINQNNKYVSGAELRKLLLDVSRTLKAFEFISDMVTIRQNLRDEGIENSKDFCVFVIDEIQDAARNEMLIRKAMDNYMSKVEGIDIYKQESKVSKSGAVEVVQKRDGKVKDLKNWDKDPGYLFCKKWISWANDVAATNWQTLVTKQLRNSRCTIITIFQQNRWFTQDEKGIGHSGAVKSSRIGHMMLELSQKTVRVVGKGGIAGGTNSWGDLDKKSYTWSDEVQSGKWVIATGEGAIGNDAILVRPFKVFTTDLGDGVKCQFDNRFDGADKCRTQKYDDTDENGDAKQDPNGLDSYTHYMFNNLHDELVQKRDNGLTPEDVLEKSFKYFDEALRKNGMAKGVNDYFYSIPDMIEAVKTEDSDGYDSLGVVDDDTISDFDVVDSDGNTVGRNGGQGFDLHDTDQSDDFLDSLNFDDDDQDSTTEQNPRSSESDRDTDDDEFLDLDLDDIDEENDTNSSEQFNEQSGDTIDFQDTDSDSSSWDSNQEGMWSSKPGLTEQGGFGPQVQSTGSSSSLGSEDAFKPQTQAQRPQRISRNNIGSQFGVSQQDSDGFDTFIGDYQINDSSGQGQESQYSQAQMDSLETILYDNKLDNVTKLQLIGEIIRKNNVKVNEADCVPLESQMLQEQVTTDPRTGLNVFSAEQQNRPHVLGSSTIQAQRKQIQKIRNGQPETDKSLQDRYDVVLDVINQAVPESTVIRLMITNNTVQVNGRNLYLGNIINNNIQMPDIFSLHETFDRFGNLKMLMIDMQIFGEIQGELQESNPIPKIFMMCPSLESLVLLGQNRQIQYIDRDNCNDLDDQTLRMIKSQDYQDKIDVVSAQYLPESEYNNQPVYVKRRIEKTQTRMNTSSFGQKNRRFTSNQVKRSGMAAIRRESGGGSRRAIRRQVNGIVDGVGSMLNRFNRK